MAALSAETHAVVCAGAAVVVSSALLDVHVVVANALAVCRIVVPNVGAMVDIDVAVAPVAAAAPVIAPAADRPGGTEGDTRRDHAGADIGGVAEVIGRIVCIGPRAIHRRGLVIGNVHGVRISLLNHDDLLALLLLD